MDVKVCGLKIAENGDIYAIIEHELAAQRGSILFPVDNREYVLNELKKNNKREVKHG